MQRTRHVAGHGTAIWMINRTSSTFARIGDLGVTPLDGSKPNYAAVVVEGIALPLIHAAWITAAGFTVLNAALLTVRIRAENAAIASITPTAEPAATVAGTATREELVRAPPGQAAEAPIPA